MPPLEEPSVSEMVRTLGAQLANVSLMLNRIESTMGMYVTQEQRTADQSLAAAREERQNEKIGALEQSQANRNRVIVANLIAPIIVGVVVWLLTRGSV